MRRALAALLVALVSAGCLSSTHRIPNRELRELANRPAEERGRRVRVVQAFAGDEPPAANRVDSDTPIVFVGVHTSIGGGGGGSSGASGGHGSHASSSAAKVASDKGKGWLVLAAVAAVGLAVTEGARYDGWVALHPMHPVHLYGWSGEYLAVPLAQLDAQTAAWARRAYVRPEEGPWRTLGRAPLDRAGFTYSVLFGQGQIHAGDGTVNPGFLGRIQFGLFPAHQVGVLADIAFGWRDHPDLSTTFDARYALELQVMPLAAGKLHGGAYGQLGVFTHLDDLPSGRDSTGRLAGGGLLLQLDITTRLALTLRAGMVALHGDPLTELQLGLSIY